MLTLQQLLLLLKGGKLPNICRRRVVEYISQQVALNDPNTWQYNNCSGFSAPVLC